METYMKLVSIVVPFYNEEPMAPHFFSKLYEVLEPLKQYQFEIVAVNDGSKDKTLDILKGIQKEHKEIRIVNLSRNFGHEPAVAAGLSVAKGDAIIPMDADLQDPPEVIPLLLEKWEEGYDVVNARRKQRKKDSFMKKTTAQLFYKFIHKHSGKVKVPQDVGHYRLVSRRVLDEVLKLGEITRVFRVEVPFVGFKTTFVDYARPEREYGETHYNYKSMLELASDSITSTSPNLLRFILKLTVALVCLNALNGLSLLTFAILHWTNAFRGIGEFGLWMWLIIFVLVLMTTIIMGSLSLMAEYQSKMMKEVQHRPFFIIDEIIE